MHHLPLVFFTVFVQAATGLMLCFGLNRLSAAKIGGAASPEVDNEPQMLMWGLFIIGIGASFIHLGKPANVMNVFGGIAHGSPLSFEILCAVLFGALCLLYSFMSRKGSGHKASSAILVLAIISGLALSYAIVNVYTVSAVPLWDSAWTFVQFFMSMIALGISALLFMWSRSRIRFQPAWKKWNMAAVFALVALIVCALSYYGWCAHVLGQNGAEMPDVPLMIARLLFQCAALILLWMASRSEAAVASKFYAGVFLCILASELAGRVFFYNLQQFSVMMLNAA